MMFTLKSGNWVTGVNGIETVFNKATSKIYEMLFKTFV